MMIRNGRKIGHGGIDLGPADPLTTPNHNEAWSLAHMKSPESNLARCYIELRELCAKLEGNIPASFGETGDATRFRDIVHANDL